MDSFYSNAWENPLIWSCHYVSDAKTDVYVDGGTLILNSNATVRSITVSPNEDTKVTINTGYTLTVGH